ncbi:Ger(x)C family germination protein [Paenibacillus taihuensis]|uniref:Ger(X)C family germination protein n=1 Tax=Paenibacillus taihuensis TaxID=1156355 RepID=A0A3D9RPR7_9BACL|nr:Ger(x)C family spore germination protein [Paenibacillus taihuensis]REE77684.1 Ger(x)C family germination protein [Paenibacillus taihuensis]
MGKTVNMLILIWCCAFLLTGCWDRKEISDINLVLGIGIDKGERKRFKFTAQWLPPKLEQNGHSSSEVYSVEVNSLSEAKNTLAEVSSARPAFSHVGIVVIGEKQAREGIADLLEELGREFQIRRTVYFFVTPGKGSEILAVKTSAGSASQELKQLDKDWKNTATMYKVNYNQLYQRVLDPNQLAFMPVVQRNQHGDMLVHRVGGMGIFQKGILKAELTGSSAKDLMYLQGKIAQGTFDDWTIDGELVVSETVDESCAMRMKVDNGKIAVFLSVKEEITIKDMYGEWNLSVPAETSRLEQKIEKALAQRLKLFLDRMRRQNLDILNVAINLQRYHKKAWGQMSAQGNEHILNHTDFHLKVHVDINNSGAYRKHSESASK